MCIAESALMRSRTSLLLLLLFFVVVFYDGQEEDGRTTVCFAKLTKCGEFRMNYSHKQEWKNCILPLVLHSV